MHWNKGSHPNDRHSGIRGHACVSSPSGGSSQLAPTLVHYSVFYSFYRILGVPSAALGNALGATCGITSSFIGSRYFVFPKRRRHLGRELECFLALYAAIALVNAVVMLLWTDVGRLNYNVGFTLAVVLQGVLAFLGNRYLVFNARGRMS